MCGYPGGRRPSVRRYRRRADRRRRGAPEPNRPLDIRLQDGLGSDGPGRRDPGIVGIEFGIDGLLGGHPPGAAAAQYPPAGRAGRRGKPVPGVAVATGAGPGLRRASLLARGRARTGGATLRGRPACTLPTYLRAMAARAPPRSVRPWRPGDTQRFPRALRPRPRGVGCISGWPRRPQFPTRACGGAVSRERLSRNGDRGTPAPQLGSYAPVSH